MLAALSAVLVASLLTASSASGAGMKQRRLDGLVRSMTDKPLADTAREVVAAIADLDDASYGAYLLDLVRIGYSNVAADEALDALAQLSGLPRGGTTVLEYLRYGGWVLDDAPTPGPDYLGFKAAVYYQVDPDFVPLLRLVDDRRVLAGLQWGGVGVGAIGELNDPVRVPMTQPPWATPNEQVFGLVGERGAALAYPERILARHELSNDALDGVPVAVTFCTLCRTVRVYDRRVGGRVLTLKTSGLLLSSNKVMVDTETGSLWQQYNGRAIAGPLKGTTLRGLDVEVSTWASWLTGHPTSAVIERPLPTVIDGETGVPIGYDYQPGAALAHYYSLQDLWYPVPAAPPDLAPKTEVATLDVGGGRLAVSVAALAERGPVVLRVGRRLVVAVPVPASVRFRDATETGWAEGSLTDATQLGRLDALPLVRGAQSFWFAWYGEHPDTDWWPRS